MSDVSIEQRALAIAMRIDGSNDKAIREATGMSAGQMKLDVAQAVAEARRRGVKHSDLCAVYRVGNDFIKRATAGINVIIDDAR